VVHAVQSRVAESNNLSFPSRSGGENPHGDVFVALVACLIKAEKAITQVSFFKFSDVSASFKASGQKVSINRLALKDLGPDHSR
jgi:hypothetical protein